MSKPDRFAQEQPPTSDIAHELQFHVFSQIATLSTGGAGLTLTLAGAVFDGFSLPVMLATACFTFSALLCLTAQISGVQNLFDRKPSRKAMFNYAVIAIFLMGMGIGTLGMGVALGGQDAAAASQSVR